MRRRLPPTRIVVFLALAVAGMVATGCGATTTRTVTVPSSAAVAATPAREATEQAAKKRAAAAQARKEARERRAEQAKEEREKRAEQEKEEREKRVQEETERQERAQAASQQHESESRQNSGGGTTVPNVDNVALPRAEQEVTSKGLTVKIVGGGLFGVVIKSDWTVCSTKPPPGASVQSGARVELVVERSCE
jgi:flagellar biosynthesis GTPase FlhF